MGDIREDLTYLKLYQKHWTPYTGKYTSIFVIEFYANRFVSYHRNVGSRKKDFVHKINVNESDMKVFLKEVEKYHRNATCFGVPRDDCEHSFFFKYENGDKGEILGLEVYNKSERFYSLTDKINQFVEERGGTTFHKYINDICVECD